MFSLKTIGSLVIDDRWTKTKSLKDDIIKILIECQVITFEILNSEKVKKAEIQNEAKLVLSLIEGESIY
jgi:hypothetical protein